MAISWIQLLMDVLSVQLEHTVAVSIRNHVSPVQKDRQLLVKEVMHVDEVRNTHFSLKSWLLLKSVFIKFSAKQAVVVRSKCEWVKVGLYIEFVLVLLWLRVKFNKSLFLQLYEKLWTLERSFCGAWRTLKTLKSIDSFLVPYSLYSIT